MTTYVLTAVAGVGAVAVVAADSTVGVGAVVVTGCSSFGVADDGVIVSGVTMG